MGLWDMVGSLLDLYKGASTAIRLLLSLAVFLLTAAAVHKMAKDSGLRRPWLAWVPFAHAHTLGEIADTHTRRNEGRTTVYRQYLLWLSVASNGGMTVAGAAAVLTAWSVLTNGAFGMDGIPLSLWGTVRALCSLGVGYAVLLVSVALALLTVTVAYRVLRYAALYQVFKLYDRKNAPIYLILCILFASTQFLCPVLMLFLSQKGAKFGNAEPAESRTE